jgi:hypothetical protein
VLILSGVDDVVVLFDGVDIVTRFPLPVNDGKEVGELPTVVSVQL